MAQRYMYREHFQPSLGREMQVCDQIINQRPDHEGLPIGRQRPRLPRPRRSSDPELLRPAGARSLCVTYAEGRA